MKDKFFFSFTTTLLAFLRGEITSEDIQSARFCFNCAVKHALPWTEYAYDACHDKIAYEAGWVVPRNERDHKVSLTPTHFRYGRHLINITDLPQEYHIKARAWNTLMHQAEDEGRLFFSLNQFKGSRYSDDKFGQVLKVARGKAGISSRKLAKLVDLSHVSVLNYENGKRFPTYGNAKKLIKTLENEKES